MHYVIGIDGGGTKTKLLVSDLSGRILHTEVAGPSNILSSGYEIVRNSIQCVIQKGVIDQGYLLETCRAICIGVAGGARESVRKQIEGIVRENGYRGKLIVTHDAETALVGGTQGEDGVLIIAGTGAICYGRVNGGMFHRASGWGHIIGDEGSGYSIGVKIINAVMKAYDGRGKETVLKELLLNEIGIKSEEEIIQYVYSVGDIKQHIAAYARLIEKACDYQDEVALKIIEETVNDLFEAISAVLQRLDLVNKEVKVVANGSVLIKNQYIYNALKKKVCEEYSYVQFDKVMYDASYGAVLLSLQELKN